VAVLLDHAAVYLEVHSAAKGISLAGSPVAGPMIAKTFFLA
jgi:hypothetical protein